MNLVYFFCGYMTRVEYRLQHIIHELLYVQQLLFSPVYTCEVNSRVGKLVTFDPAPLYEVWYMMG